MIAPCAMRRHCPSAICIRQAKTVAVAHRSGIDFGRKGPSKLYVEEARVLALSCAEGGRWADLSQQSNVAPPHCCSEWRRAHLRKGPSASATRRIQLRVAALL